MIGPVIGALTTFLVFAFGGSALWSSAARQRHTINAELDIYAKLPSGAGRGLLAGYLDEKVGLYVIRQADPLPDRVRTGYWLGAAFGVCGTAWWVWGVVWLSTDRADGWFINGPGSLIGAVLGGAGLGFLQGARRAKRAWQRERLAKYEAGGGVAEHFRTAIEREARGET